MAKRYEKQWGPLPSLFFLGGSDAGILKLFLMPSLSNYDPEIKTVGPRPDVSFFLDALDDETKAYATAQCRAYLSRPRISDEIATHLVGGIREVAKRSELDNDWADIRRLSREFKREVARPKWRYSLD